MFWLALGSSLLVLSALTAEANRFDAVTALSLVGLVAVGLWSLSVYAGITAAAALLGGSFAAVLLIALAGRSQPLWARSLVLSAGVASCLFALFGPADGLF